MAYTAAEFRRGIGMFEKRNFDRKDSFKLLLHDKYKVSQVSFRKFQNN